LSNRSDRKENRKKNQSKYHHLITLSVLRVAVVVIALNIWLFPEIKGYVAEGDNRFTIYMNGQAVGVTDDRARVYEYYSEAKRVLAEGTEDLVFTEFPEITTTGEEVIWGSVDSEETIVTNMAAVLSANEVQTLEHAYSVKVNGVVVNLASEEEVREMFQTAVDRYSTDGAFAVSLTRDSQRELNVLTAEISAVQQEEEPEEEVLRMAGAEQVFALSEEDLFPEEEGFESFTLGITEMSFSEPIEVVEAYLPESDIDDIAYATNLLTEEQEIQQIYEVQPGDTLSEIALTVGLPLDDIIALNDSLENENSYIYVDQELIITVPEPELSVIWTVDTRYEETYDLPIEYVYNDEWYSNQMVTLQQPSAGYHDVVARVTYSNDTVLDTAVLYEQIIASPVAKVVEIGTIVPPTYIKPLSGGRLSSGFGGRNAPVAGASTYHRGVDWATPIGTSIYASSGGTVARAGWGSGYGYVVYINHPDGRQTRYAHLSRIYVNVGDYVSQGQVIAASGNTGRSSGPHLHFEILINGVQVNPLEYL